MSKDVELKDSGLNELISLLKNKMPKSRVGILGSGARQDGNSNAEIGLKHEFGDGKTPMRSFLRIPLTDNLQKYLDNAGGVDNETLKKCIDEKSLVPLFKKIAVLGEQVVLDGFETGGFGKWKPSNMKFKKNQQTLVETQQLRNSITSEVKK